MTNASSPSSGALYDAYYYQTGCGLPYERRPEWLSLFEGIADKIVQQIKPRTVLDAGCAMGFLVEALRDRGVAAYGIDISDYAIAQVREDIRPYCQIGSLAEPLPQRYDLIVNIEVLEHMPAVESEAAIKHFCQASDDILFSSTPLDYKETTHFNVQSPEYWAYHFALQDFVRDVDFDGSFINPWATRFRRTQEPWPKLIQTYERRFWPLWKESTDLRHLASDTRQQLSVSEERRQALERHVENLNAHIQHLEASNGALTAQRQGIEADLRAIHPLLSEREQKIHQLQHETEVFWQSPSGRIARLMQQTREAIAPPTSLRERWLNTLAQMLFKTKG